MMAAIMTGANVKRRGKIAFFLSYSARRVGFYVFERNVSIGAELR
jgi:hypothetical protein